MRLVANNLDFRKLGFVARKLLGPTGRQLQGCNITVVAGCVVMVIHPGEEAWELFMADEGEIPRHCIDPVATLDSDAQRLLFDFALDSRRDLGRTERCGLELSGRTLTVFPPMVEHPLVFAPWVQTDIGVRQILAAQYEHPGYRFFR